MRKNIWKEAVLDALAQTGQDLPVGTPPDIVLEAVTTWHAELKLRHEHYLLGNQLDMVVHKRVLVDAQPVYWDEVSQKWEDAR